MSGVQHLEVEPGEAGQRLDRWLRAKFPQLTQGRIEKMLRKGEVRLDGGRAKSSSRIEAHQMVRIPPVPDGEAPPPKPMRNISDADVKLIRSMVLFEDEHMIALNKPPGIPVQGGTGQSRHIDGMLGALAGDGDRPKLVHRIDKDTSGLLVLARTGAAARALTGAFRSKAARKLYWAACVGVPKVRKGTVAYALEKLPGPMGEKMICIDPRELSDHPHAKRSVTDYAVVETVAKRASWVALRPVTGRTHQLRAHMAAINCPIIGDGKYGPSGEDAERRVTGAISNKLHLHARRIAVPHPDGSGRIVDLTAPIPEHMSHSWNTFAWDLAAGDDESILPEPSRE